MAKSTTLLHHLVRARNWTVVDFTEKFAAEAARLFADEGEQRQAATITMRTVERWLAGDVASGPYPQHRRVLESMFTTTTEALFAPPKAPGAAAGDELPQHIRDEIKMDAHQSSENAGNLAAEAVDDTSIAQLEDDLKELAGSYAAKTPLETYREARRIRDRGQRLAELTSRPNQLHALHSIVAAAYNMLASATFDLGYLSEASELARSAEMTARHVDHDGLASWALGMQSLLAYWRNEPTRAVTLASQGLELAPAGAGKARLLAISARASSHLGDRAMVERQVQASLEAAAEETTDHLHADVGGEFTFTLGRLERCHGTALLQVRDAPAAIDHTRRAIELELAVPEETRSRRLLAEARIDLAAAYLLDDDLDAAAEQLTAVFKLPADHRVASVLDRANRVRGLLVVPRFRDVPAARSLGGAIEAFASDSVTLALPSGL